MGLKITNNAFGVLNASITNSATTLVLQSGQGARFPTLGASDYFYATLIDTSNNLEIVKVTARSTDTMTIVRAQDNTTARAYTANDRFELRPTAAMLNEVIAKAEAALPSTGGTVTGNLTLSSGNLTLSSGHVTAPYQPAFAVSYNGGVIANTTIIPWNAPHFNIGGHYNASTGRFTAPVSGRYLFNMQVHHAQGQGTPPSHHYFDIRLNGGTVYRAIGYWTTDNWYELTATCILSLNTNDYVDVFAFITNSQWMGGNRPDHNRFQGYLIG